MPDASTAAATAAPNVRSMRTQLSEIERQVARVVRGNPNAVRLVLASVLARGHVLIEDVPGVGKTTLARAMARVLGCSFSRVQFTADLLPSDLIGVQVLDATTGDLRFRKGPLFAHIVLADEINRASPKTQSALLEAMADRQVTVDDKTYPLELPFSVLATQNPVEHHGAYPLPESQLDRFAVLISLGYPPADDERALLRDHRGVDDALLTIEAVLTPDVLRSIQEAVLSVHVSDGLVAYLYDIVEATRTRPEILLGCSTRGALAYIAVARAYAFLQGREHVLPDDIKHLAPYVLVHRLALRGVLESAQRAQAAALVDEILAEVPAPR